MRSFFIDGSNLKKIETACDFIEKNKISGYFRGVTTNPSSLSLEKVNSFSLMIDHINEIFELININNMAFVEYDPEVHVEIPSSTMPREIAFEFIRELNNKKRGKIVYKIPPRIDLIDYLTTQALNTNYTFDLKLNVTGLSSVYSCIHSLQYPFVSYASLIPGRMKKYGIDPSKDMNYIRSFFDESTQHNDYYFEKEIIAGSLRTYEDIVNSLRCNMIPTIGLKLFEEIIDESTIMKDFCNVLGTTESYGGSYMEWIDMVPVDKRHFDCTVDFFEEMDRLGEPLYDSFNKHRFSSAQGFSLDDSYRASLRRSMEETGEMA